MHSYFNLADNPLFVKHVRSRLRRSTLLPSVIIVCFLSMCIVWMEMSVFKEPGLGSHLFFWMQSIILLLMGGSQVASAVAYVKESGILDFHRVTPVPPRVQVLGFLLGAPIREWTLFACTLPFGFFIAVTGPWGLLGFTKVLLVQITGAMLYHSIGLVTGLGGKSARAASGRLVAIVVGLNVVSNNLSSVGVYGPALLSPLPVYYEVAFANFPMLQGGQGGRQQPGAAANPLMRGRGEARFFGVPVPLVFQTLGFQGSIFAFLMIAVGRRFRSPRMPLYTKPQALAFLVTLAFLTLGSLWETRAEAIILSTAYCLAIASFWLTAAVTPTLGDYMKGLQRARRQGNTRVPDWSDLASNKVVILAFALVILAALGLADAAAPMQPPKGFESWGPLAVAVLAVLSYGWSVQYFYLHYERRAQSYFSLYLFVVWIMPVAIGGLFLASGVKEMFALMAASPFVGIYSSSLWNAPIADKVVIQVFSVAPSAILSVLFAALLLSEEHRRAAQVQKEHEVRHHDDPESAAVSGKP